MSTVEYKQLNYVYSVSGTHTRYRVGAKAKIKKKIAPFVFIIQKDNYQFAPCVIFIRLMAVFASFARSDRKISPSHG